jgi:hypothetical protein
VSEQAASWDTVDCPKQYEKRMANQKQVLDVQVSKGITTAQSNEHLRDRSEKAEKYAMSKGNYDPTRKRLNFEIAPGGKIHPIDTSRSIPKRMADILSHRGIKDPNEGLLEPKYRTVVNIIFGGSRQRMQELAFGTQQVDFEKGADNTMHGGCAAGAGAVSHLFSDCAEILCLFAGAGDRDKNRRRLYRPLFRRKDNKLYPPKNHYR